MITHSTKTPFVMSLASTPSRSPTISRPEAVGVCVGLALLLLGLVAVGASAYLGFGAKTMQDFSISTPMP
jgi:hypothetical protein